MQSSGLSRYLPPMMQGLAGAISKALSDIVWTMGWIVQLPYHSPIAFHSWMSMWWFNLVSEPECSEMEMGNLLRVDWFHHSGRTQGLHQWRRIIDITSELNQAVQMSISCGEKNHPFSDELLKRIRQCLGATSEDGVAEGHPFLITLISRLAKTSGGPDWEYPLTLQDRVPIGVDEPTLTSQGFGQAKRNSRGSQRNGKSYLHLQDVITMTQQKPFQTLSRRHSWRRQRWA